MEAAALVMAGGAATRMRGAPKPLLTACGKPLIMHVLSALEPLSRIVVLALSPKSPEGLLSYCGSRLCIYTPGAGYPEDLRIAASTIAWRPLIVAPADLVGLEERHIDALLKAPGDSDVVTLTCQGKPLGVSLLRGRGWRWSSVDAGCGIVNVNTWRDLKEAEKRCR